MGTRRAVGPRSLLVILVAFVLALSSCSGVPYWRGRWFEPYPTPGPPAPPTIVRPDVDLTGTLVTDRGLTATVTSQLWFGETTSSPLLSRPHPTGWLKVRVGVRGTTTVTNTSAQPNPAAASVFYEINAAYPLGSRVCDLLVAPDDLSLVAGGYCWQLLATATPFSYDQGPPVAMTPGQSQTAAFGTAQHWADVSIDVPEADLTEVVSALRRPALVAVTTNDISGLGSHFHFRRNCRGAIDGPSSKDREQHVNLSSTVPLTCGQLPQLGFGY